MLDIKISLADTRKPQPDPDTLVFGKTFTDHKKKNHLIF